MSEKKDVSRRRFIELGGGVVAGLVIGGAVGYVAKPTITAPPVTLTSTVTETVTGTVTATAPATTSVATPTIAPLYTGSASLSFWNMPFVTQEVSPKYVAQWQAAVKQALPNCTVDPFFGPGDYGPLRQKYLVQASTGTPDVIEGLLEDIAIYVKQSLVEPLDDRFNAWADKSQFVQASITPLTINGKLQALPYNTNARGLIYRKDLLAQYGLDVPTTWADMLKTARTITQKTNKQTYGFFTCTLVGDPRAPQEFISWYFQVSQGKDMFDVSGAAPKLQATQDQLAQVLGLYNDLFTPDPTTGFTACDPAQKGTGWPVEDPGYAAGKWAMAPMGTWEWGRRSESATAKDILENKSVVTQLPIPEGGGHYTYFEVKPIGMNSASKNKDAAWALMEFICSKDEMGMWLADSGGVPARKDSLTIDAFKKPSDPSDPASAIGPWIQMFASFLDTGVALSPVNWGPVNEANMKAVNYVIYGQKSPKDAAAWLVDQIHTMEKNKVL
jgi:ABC-type glycerol-3-phosphate transport system substrate-binding protein